MVSSNSYRHSLKIMLIFLIRIALFANAAALGTATEATPAEPAGSDVEQPSTGDDAAGRDHPEDWHALVPRLEVSGFGAQLANNGVCRHLDEKQVVLELARSNEFLATAGAKRKLEAALAEEGRKLVPGVDEGDEEEDREAALEDLAGDRVVARVEQGKQSGDVHGILLASQVSLQSTIARIGDGGN